MKTSTFLIEYIIIGTQSLFWVYLFSNQFFNFNLENTSYPLPIIIVIPLIYPIGIIIDTIAYLIDYRIYSNRMRKKIWNQDPGSDLGLDKQLYLKSASDNLAIRGLININISIKIIRSGIVNVFLAFISLTFYEHLHYFTNKISPFIINKIFYPVVTCSVILHLLILSIILLWYIDRKYALEAKKIWDQLKTSEKFSTY